MQRPLLRKRSWGSVPFRRPVAVLCCCSVLWLPVRDSWFLRRYGFRVTITYLPWPMPSSLLHASRPPVSGRAVISACPGPFTGRGESEQRTTWSSTQIHKIRRLPSGFKIAGPATYLSTNSASSAYGVATLIITGAPSPTGCEEDVRTWAHRPGPQHLLLRAICTSLALLRLGTNQRVPRRGPLSRARGSSLAVGCFGSRPFQFTKRPNRRQLITHSSGQ